MDKKTAYKFLYQFKNNDPNLFTKKIGKLSKEDIEYFAAVILLELNKNKNSEIDTTKINSNKNKIAPTKKIINPQVTYKIDKKV